MPPATREGPPRQAVPSQNVELAGPDDAERKRIAEIIQGLRLTLPQPTPEQRRWDERARNRTELAAWLNGRHRICDLVGSNG